MNRRNCVNMYLSTQAYVGTQSNFFGGNDMHVVSHQRSDLDEKLQAASTLGLFQGPNKRGCLLKRGLAWITGLAG